MFWCSVSAGCGVTGKPSSRTVYAHLARLSVLCRHSAGDWCTINLQLPFPLDLAGSALGNGCSTACSIHLLALDVASLFGINGAADICMHCCGDAVDAAGEVWCEVRGELALLHHVV